MKIEAWLLLPAFVHVAQITMIGMRMGLARYKAVRTGRVRIKDVALDNSAWPDDVKKLANNYRNQFELPVLYYAALAFILATGLVDWPAAVLSWGFIASRVVHTLIHTGANVVVRRFQVFLAGFAMIVLLWAWFGLRLFVIG
ncbi:MAG: MAPEG family protein [Alphaproteobacteria bacterium]|nr:MAPEG family protein [Alphaproteobacteria bacterium]